MSQFAATRRVWADLTQHPSASLREVAERTGLPLDVVQLAVHALDTAGYVEHDPRESRARHVALPMITEFRIRSPAGSEP